MKKTVLSFIFIVSISTILCGASPKNRIIFCHNGPLSPESKALFLLTEKKLSRKRTELGSFDYEGDLKRLLNFTNETIKNNDAKGIILLSQNQGISKSLEKQCRSLKLPLVILGNVSGSVNLKGLIIHIPFRDDQYLNELALTMANQADNSEWEDNTLFSSALFIAKKSNIYPTQEFGKSHEKRITDTILKPIIFTYSNNGESDLLSSLRDTGIKNPSFEITVTPSEMLPTLKKTLIPQGRWLKTGNKSHSPIIALDADLISLRFLHEEYIDIVICTDLNKTAEALIIPLLAATDNKSLPFDFKALVKSPILTLTKNDISEKILRDYGGEEYLKNEKNYLYISSPPPQ